MLEAGAPVPDATVYRGPGDAVTLRQLSADRPALFLFYLFDWSST